jgi:hypothetical protein
VGQPGADDVGELDDQQHQLGHVLARTGPRNSGMLGRALNAFATLTKPSAPTPPNPPSPAGDGSVEYLGLSRQHPRAKL